MTRDDVLKLLAVPGATQASVAAELGISQQRVSQLKRGVSGRPAASTTPPASTSPDATTQPPASTSANTVQEPPASTSPAVFVQPETVTALREEIRAELTAKLKPRFDQMAARIAELETAPGSGPCPGCAQLQADYAELEEMLTDARRRLFAYEEA